MPHKLRKVRRLRGSRTHGFGQVAGHRKSGSRGGKGRAGIHKHKFVPPAPKFEGRHGFTRRATIIDKVLNVGEIDDLAEGLSRTGKTGEEAGRTVLDLHALGYTKLLGKGSLKGGYVLIVGKHSGMAAEKVAGAGGELRAPTGR